MSASPRHALFGLLLVYASFNAGAGTPQILLPDIRLKPEQLGIIINDEDPLSRQIADYYRKVRQIPDSNLIHVRLDPHNARVQPNTFLSIWNEVQQKTPATIEAYALTWAKPYRVGCMSITTAFAAGFDKRWCSASQCAPTQKNPLFDSRSAAPWQQFRIRPTMSIAALDFPRAKQLIDRGKRSDNSWPAGTAYLLSTSDRARNVRSVFFPRIKTLFRDLLPVRILQQDVLRNRKDILFYFTGKLRVGGLDSLSFLPGAVADHLTSTGGQLTDSRQMSALRWLEAGATGSYGTVTEPCNLPGKFPNPGILMNHYLHGRSLLRSYWASVQMPGEGLFIGDPLAHPFAGYRIESTTNNQYRLITHQLWPGRYAVQTAPSLLGPFSRPISLINASLVQTEFYLPETPAPIYRILPLNPRQPDDNRS